MNAPALATRFGRGFRSVGGFGSYAQPLTDDEIRATAPSVFAENKHGSRSDRYTYIPTIDLLVGLRKEGFEPFYAAQAKCRNPGMEDYTKHLLRLRQVDAKGVDGTVSDIILVNSHNGGCCYQMLAGAFRCVCANGIVSGDVMRDLRIPHKGDVVERVIEGAYEVIGRAEQTYEAIEAMRSVHLDRDEREAFAIGAAALRWEDPEKMPIQPTQLLEPRRSEDGGRDLWTTFNVAQEHLIRGGDHGRQATSHGGRRRKVTTRPVAGIDGNIALNRALFAYAQALAALAGKRSSAAS